MEGWRANYVSRQKIICKIKYGFEDSTLTQMLILVLHLARHIGSRPGFNLAQVISQDLLLESLLKVTNPLEDVRGCYFQVKLLPSKKLSFVSFNEISLKLMKNGFYLILNALFVLKVVKFLSFYLKFLVK